MSEAIESEMDTEKYRILITSVNRQRLSGFWENQRRQMESIKSAIRYQAEQGSYESQTDTVMTPLVEAAADIGDLCEERVNRLDDRHEGMIDWIGSSLEADLNISVKKLTIIVLAFTAVNVSIAFGSLLSQSGVAIRDALVFSLLFGGVFFGLVYALVERQV